MVAQADHISALGGRGVEEWEDKTPKTRLITQLRVRTCYDLRPAAPLRHAFSNCDNTHLHLCCTTIAVMFVLFLFARLILRI